MKKIFYILIFLNFSLLPCFSQTGWIKQSPYPQSADLNTTKFFNNNTGYAAAYWQNFIRTTNGGINWTVHNFGSTQAFDMDFVDMNTGYIVSANGNYYKTTNGGINWNSLSLNINNNLNTIKFIGDIGYIFGTGAAVYKSTNRGNTWLSKSLDTAIGFVDACFINANTGHAIARDPQANTKELITTNGGDNWYFQQLATTEAANSIYFVNKDTGYIAGGFIYSRIQKTTNGGINWSVQYPPGYSLYDVMFADNSTGYALGRSGTLIKTNDGGESWESYGLNIYIRYLLTIYVIDADNCYAMGINGNIFKTTNGGTNWHNLFSGTVNDLNKVFFVNVNTGYAVGRGDYYDGVVKTTNGGQYWFIQPLPTTAPLTSVFFINPDSGYAVGWSGTIIKTTNGGSNWLDLFQPALGSFNDVAFLDLYTGYIISDTHIYKTTNGGLNWEVKYNPGGYSVFLVNSLIGYAAGYPHLILKTTDGGENWSTQTIPTMEEIKSIYFLNVDTGYAASAYDGIIIKTTNGGDNWIIKYSGTNSYFNSISFVNETTGYVAGGLRTILKTTNGGDNWYNQNTGFTDGFYSIQFLNDSVGYVCGKWGIILKTTTGGEPIGVNPINIKVPSKINLFQNYPNPFNPSTKIRFDVPYNTNGKSSQVKLTVYDLLGKEIESLVNSNLYPGQYEKVFDATDYSSGIYFYVLNINGEIFTKKMCIVK